MPEGLAALGQERVAGSVEATLNYLVPITEKPHTYNYDPPPGVARQNFESDPRRVLIEGIRGREGGFSLDHHGFVALQHQSRETLFAREEAIRAVYYPESEALLRHLLGASLVLIFDHTIRRRDPDRREGEGIRQPVARVHVDQTEKSGRERVLRHLPDEAETLLKGRVRIINLWRPIRGPVHDHPLAMADGTSINSSDLIATDLLYRDRVGETYSVRYDPAHRWYYWSGMQADEALLLKCYDSAGTRYTRFSPHTAFVDPRVGPSALPRQSIELRALVFGG